MSRFLTILILLFSASLARAQETSVESTVDDAEQSLAERMVLAPLNDLKFKIATQGLPVINQGPLHFEEIKWSVLKRYHRWVDNGVLEVETLEEAIALAAEKISIRKDQRCKSYVVLDWAQEDRCKVVGYVEDRNVENIFTPICMKDYSWDNHEKYFYYVEYYYCKSKNRAKF